MKPWKTAAACGDGNRLPHRRHTSKVARPDSAGQHQGEPGHGPAPRQGPTAEVEVKGQGQRVQVHLQGQVRQVQIRINGQVPAEDGDHLTVGHS